MLLLCLALLCAPVFALEADLSPTDVQIRSLEAQYTVAEDGACTVVWTAEMRFSDGVQQFSLPLPAAAQNLAVSALSYTVEREGDTRFVTLTSPAQLGDQTLTVSYSLPETAAADSDGQTCTLQLLLATRACAIDRYSAVITLPSAFESLPQFESGYYGELIENYLDISIDDGVISLASNQPLRDHESLTMTLDLPEGYFDLRFIAGKTAAVDTILFWILLAVAVVYWLLFLRNRVRLPKPQAMPPLAGNAGATPYILTADAPDLAIMVMHWASLGYLTVERLRGGKLLLTKQIDMGNERKGYEIQLFRSLFGRREECTAPSEAFRTVRQAAPLAAKSYWERRLFVPRSGKPQVLRALGVALGLAMYLMAFDRVIPAQSWRWFVIVPLVLLGGLSCLLLQPLATCTLRRKPERTLLLALLALIYLVVSVQGAALGALPVVCVLAQLLIGLALISGGRRTPSGLRHAETLLGFRRHLSAASAERLMQLLAEDPQYFYRTLPYADALRIGGRFARKFGSIPLESCTWLTAEGRAPKTAADFRRLYLSALDTLREQTDAPITNFLKNLRRKKRR